VGPRQTGRYGMVIPTFVRQAISGQPITVFGSGEQSRCFCHVADIVRGIQALALEDRAVGEVFNLGGNEEIAILPLAERVKKLAKSESAIRRLSYDDAYEQGFEDMMRRVPDTSKAKQLIGFAPTCSLDEIIRDVIAFERRSES
jgi:UDP-glucose 4-epimerase